MIDPQKVAVDSSGSFKPTTMRIAFLGPHMVDTLWALSGMTIKLPFDVGWTSVCYPHDDNQTDEDSWQAAKEDWLEDPKQEDWLIGIAAGDCLVWNVFDKIRDSSHGDLRFGSGSRALRRGFSGAIGDNPDDFIVEDLQEGPIEVDPGADPKRSCVICVPTLGKTSLLFAENLFKMCQPLGFICYLNVVLNQPVPEARELLVNRVFAMNPRPEYMLFLGDDMLPPANGFQEIAHVIEKAPDVVTAIGGLYHKKSLPRQNLAWRQQKLIQEGVDYDPGQVLEVDGMGLDFTLMRVSDVAKIISPRFKNVLTEKQTMTEDAYFWIQYRKYTGKRPFVDTGCLVGHFNSRDRQIY